jgi:hypothetical protein
MADYPNRPSDRERQDPSNPVEQPAREPNREPKRPFDRDRDREQQQPDRGSQGRPE